MRLSRLLFVLVFLLSSCIERGVISKELTTRRDISDFYYSCLMVLNELSADKKRVLEDAEPMALKNIEILTGLTPQADPWGNDYLISLETNNWFLTFHSSGPDGVLNTSDDISESREIDSW